MKSIVLFVLYLAVLLLVLEAKKSQSKKKSEDITFNSPTDPEFKEYLNDVNQKSKTDSSDAPTPEEMMKYQREEENLRKEVNKARQKHGRMSQEHVNALHTLGRNIYLQQRYEEVLSIAEEIVTIHESIDGPEHVNTAKALTNVGSTAHRLGKKRECDLAMNRALYIFLKLYGENSKEVLLHRGQMLTFHIPFAKTSGGISYDDYLFEL